MTFINHLITDRTEPGKYDWQDFNRVGAFVKDVVKVLTQAGYEADVITKTDWTRTSIQTRQEMDQYIANIQALRKILAFPPNTPTAPDTIRFLTYQRANDIERILLDLEIQLESMMRVYPKAAMPWAYAGSVLYFPEAGYPTEYILADDVTGQRYGLIVENGILKLLSVSSRFEPKNIRLLDAVTGEVWELGVESGVLYILSIEVPDNFLPEDVVITDSDTQKTYTLTVESGILAIVEVTYSLDFRSLDFRELSFGCN